ncbi:MAG: creatininase family protein [Gemmatimonadetes bacterium]|nr:creatininase family protein [Gemmatimonadota bacterium]
MSGPRSWILEESNWKSVQTAHFDVAVLPWGATEAHNLHLPYGTDTLQASEIAARAAHAASERGARVLVLPAVPYGVQTGQLDIPFCINMNPATQAAVLGDIVSALEPHGVKALVVLNGHGGNDFKPILRELQPRAGILLCTMNWWTCVDARQFFDEPGDHAGELETSAMMHIAPHLVLPLGEAGPGTAQPFRITAFREGWAWTQRQWTQVTQDTGVGDPRAASAEKGATFVAAATERIASFLVELAGMQRDDMYVGANRAGES